MVDFKKALQKQIAIDKKLLTYDQAVVGQVKAAALKYADEFSSWKDTTKAAYTLSWKEDDKGLYYPVYTWVDNTRNQTTVKFYIDGDINYGDTENEISVAKNQ